MIIENHTLWWGTGAGQGGGALGPGPLFFAASILHQSKLAIGSPEFRRIGTV